MELLILQFLIEIHITAMHGVTNLISRKHTSLPK